MKPNKRISSLMTVESLFQFFAIFSEEVSAPGCHTQPLVISVPCRHLTLLLTFSFPIERKQLWNRVDVGGGLWSRQVVLGVRLEFMFRTRNLHRIMFHLKQAFIGSAHRPSSDSRSRGGDGLCLGNVKYRFIMGL